MTIEDLPISKDQLLALVNGRIVFVDGVYISNYPNLIDLPHDTIEELIQLGIVYCPDSRYNYWHVSGMGREMLGLNANAYWVEEDVTTPVEVDQSVPSTPDTSNSGGDELIETFFDFG